VHCFLSRIVDLIGDVGKVAVDPRHLQIVVHLVEQVPQGGRVAVAGPHQPRQRLRELLLDRLFQHRPAHHGAGREETEEVTAGCLIQVSICILRAGRSHDTFAQMRCPQYRRLHLLQHFNRNRGA